MELILLDPNTLSPLLVLGFGLVVGLLHAFEPDHVAAMGTQNMARTSSRYSLRDNMGRSSILGAVWGAGHATTLVLFGMMVYIAAYIIQDWIFAGLEIGVGVMLLVLGMSAILGRDDLWSIHRHHHIHKDGTSHSHRHDHADMHHRHTHRSYVIGMIHGLAGSGALVALTIPVIDAPAMVFVFMVVFGAGSALGMSAASGLLGAPLALVGRKDSIRRLMRYGAGIISMIIGIIIAVGALTPYMAV